MRLRQLYEAPARKVVAVMPGGFHPFHPGHKSLYDWAVKQFGQTNVYVAATNDTSTRPFPFDVKKQLASFAGVPPTNFIQVKSPFNLNSYTGLLADGTALVFVRSEKDRNEQPQPDKTKKDGTPGYIKSWTGKDMEDYVSSGYMAYGPTQEFQFSGVDIKSASELRNAWPSMAPEDKRKAAEEMYPGKGIEAAKLLDNALGSEQEESVKEWVGPALKGGKYSFQIAKWLWNNKWAITFFVGAWKTIDWMSDAIDFVKKYLDNPIVRAMTKYGLPAVGVAVALYGGKKLYDELVQIKNERELDKMVRSFKPDQKEIADIEKELEAAMAEGDVIPLKKSNPANPHLDKDAIDTWNKERNQKMAQDMIKLAPEVVEYYKELKDQNKDTETAIDIIAYDFDIDKYNVKRILQANNIDEDVNELNLFKRSDNGSIKEQDPNKMKVLDWIADRVDGKEHFLSFYRKGAAWSGRLLFIKPDAAKQFRQKVENNPEHADRIKKALTSIETTSKLFTNLKIDHQVRRAN